MVSHVALGAQQLESELPPQEGRRALSLLRVPVRRRVVPTWGNRADAPSSGQPPLSASRNALPELPPVPPVSLLSQQAEKELRQLTEPIPADPGGPLQSKPGYPPPSPAHPSQAAPAFSAVSSVWPEPRYVQCRCTLPATPSEGEVAAPSSFLTIVSSVPGATLGVGS